MPCDTFRSDADTLPDVGIPTEPDAVHRDERAHHRLDALELQAMDAELAQAALDAVVIRHAQDIAALQAALRSLQQRLDTLANPAGAGGASADERPSSLADALERDRPPHY